MKSDSLKAHQRKRSTDATKTLTLKILATG